MRKSAKAKQRDRWLKSKAGQEACSANILCSPHHARNLVNRIERAYCDGWDAGYAQGVKEALENQPL